MVSKAPGKQNTPKAYSVRQRDRRFLIVPDLLAAPGAINLRIIGDDYFAVLPEGTDPESSELQRAYLQYVVDPLMSASIAASLDDVSRSNK